METALKLTAQQQLAVKDRGGNLLVSAAAGAGKTKVLVDRILDRVCTEGCHIDQFLVITYTRAAAAELRAKISAELSKRLAQTPGNTHLRAQMRRLGAAQISTVHAFCANLLRNNAAACGLPADFRVCEEQESRVLKAETMEAMLEAIYSDIEKRGNVKAFLEELAYGRDDSAVPAILFSIYDAIQSHPCPSDWVSACLKAQDISQYQDAAETPWGKYLIGATQDYIRGQMYQVDKARELCDNDAALSMAYGDALHSDACYMENLLTAGTWNDFYRTVSQHTWARLKAIKKGTTVSEHIQAQVKALRDRYKKAIDAKVKNIYGDTDEVLADLARTEAPIRGMFELVGEFTRRYTAKKELRNCMDFSDLEHEAIGILLDAKTKAPTEIAKATAARYVEIMVDEYQDTNGVQEAIFNAISNGANRFMVGDVKQSIYMFRQADPSIFLAHYNTYLPAEKAKAGQPRKVLLSQNFRSRIDILAATNAVMSACMSPAVGGVTYGEGESLTAGREDFQPLDTPAVELTAIDMGEQASQEENEELLAKSDVEARYVAQRIQQMIGHEQIQDPKTGDMRTIQAGDIAILIRSVKRPANHYVKALADLGIPCASLHNGSLMDTTEVATLYAYLQIIDNPHQDIPLVAVLASPLAGFTADDLAQIRIAWKEAPCFYDALLRYADDHDKGGQFCAQLDALRQHARTHSLTALLSELLFVTDAEDVFGSMEGGVQRMANIHKLVEMVASYESGGARGLFGFICYIESLRAQGTEFPVAPTGDASEDAVKILSVHASKGLEYPVVFLVDLSRKFNTDETKRSALLHRDLGVGVQVMDRDRMCRYPTIARTAIAMQCGEDSKSEELRILYVAMTRAQQRLVMTYCDRLERTLARLAETARAEVTPSMAQSVGNPGEWVLMAALTRSEAGPLYKKAGAIPLFTGRQDYPWQISVLDAADLGGAKLTMAELDSVEEESAPEATPNPAMVEINEDLLAQDLAYTYPHADAIGVQAKATVTGLMCGKPSLTIRRPNFAQKKDGFTAAERGTATHLFLQHADYALCHNQGAEGIRAELQRMVTQGYISEDLAPAVMVGQLQAFFSSPVGAELADIPAQQMHRETPFTIMLPANEVLAGVTTTDKVLVQGTVDIYRETNDGIIIYDFKTDFVEDKAAQQAKAKEYTPQLALYANALHQIHNKPVLQKAILFLRTASKEAV